MAIEYIGPKQAALTAVSRETTTRVLSIYRMFRLSDVSKDEAIAAAMLILAMNMRHQYIEEARPSEEVAKDWGNELLTLSRYITRIIEG